MNEDINSELSSPIIEIDSPSASLVKLIETKLTDLFEIEDITVDVPEKDYIRFRGRFFVDSPDNFFTLKERFAPLGLTPKLIRQDNTISLIAIPALYDTPNEKSNSWMINLLLFLATILSTLLIGAMQTKEGSALLGNNIKDSIIALKYGWPYSLTILLILGAHELGHYFASLYHKVPVTLPYFIPIPLPPFGTMGAFIKMKAPVPNRRVLLDIGLAGPLAGLIFAIPILLIGLSLSEMTTLQTGDTVEGNSILYALAKRIVFGRFLPDGADDVLLHPVAWAGWTGLFITGLNLIPIGQLDGGHAAYVLFGAKARNFYWPVLISLLLIVIITGNTAWILWITLLYFFGKLYAEPLDDITPVDPIRRKWAIFALILFILTFVPLPLSEIILP